MKNILIIKYVYPLILCAVVFLSCVKRTLEERDKSTVGFFELTLNWEGGISPSGTRLLIYKEDGIFHEELTVNETNAYLLCELEEGNYLIVIHNTDVTNASFSTIDEHTTAMVIAGTGTIPQEGSELVSPGNVYGVGQPDEVDIVSVVAGETTTVTATLKRLTREVKFHFSVTGLDAVAKLNGRLVGVSPGLFLSSGAALPIACCQPFVGNRLIPTKSNEEVIYEVNIELFDLIMPKVGDTDINKIDVIITDGNDKKYMLTSDITSTIREIIFENGGELPIEISLEVVITVYPDTDKITAVVIPWDNSGTGGGNPIKKQK